MKNHPPTVLQRKLLDYCQSVAVDGVARVTQHELEAAIGHKRGSIIKALATMRRRGDIDIEVIRATFITLRCEEPRH